MSYLYLFTFIEVLQLTSNEIPRKPIAAYPYRLQSESITNLILFKEQVQYRPTVILAHSAVSANAITAQIGTNGLNINVLWQAEFGCRQQTIAD